MGNVPFNTVAVNAFLSAVGGATTESSRISVIGSMPKYPAQQGLEFSYYREIAFASCLKEKSFIIN